MASNILRPILSLATAVLVCAASLQTVPAQTYIKDMARDSARSDTRTGGTIEQAGFAPGRGALRLTANIPSFQMTLWQDGQEIKNYPMGVGLKEFPMFVGLRDIELIIWNPVWIPPDSEWVAPALRGQVIQPTDPRNPLGKIKIPLGYGYLIHQAKGPQDLGNLVSHGCMRVLRKDLYDLNEKVVKAYSLEVSEAEIAAAKRTKKTFLISLGEALPLEITYDTLVVEEGRLHIYPDVYGYKKNTVAGLRLELQANGVETEHLTDEDLERMLSKAVRKKQFVIGLEEIKRGDLSGGKILPVL